ncbi:glycosyltransferase family A protein [Paraflavisolibacter sp. H34]|uniref:glycosyltransferase family A protein n=1 Tax=Huijunlia imazamoxiresistens TaxID=3127457 RepID=UPI0030184187
MQHTPLVSFCFTTFKRQYYLKKTLESIRLQSFQDYEVIVSDNDPERSGKEVVEGFRDPRFKYFPNEQNLGMKKSFNKSLERSSGSYIVMIADDDPVYPDMLETLVGLKDQYPEYGMYLGGSNYLCTHPGIAQLYGMKVGINSCLVNEPVDTVRLYSPNEFLKNFFDLKIYPAYLWSCCMVKRETLVEMGGVPDYDTPFLGDYAYLSIMGSRSGCVVINKALGHQTVHEQNFGRAQNEQLVRIGKNFIDYVSARIRHVPDWPAVEKSMKHFVAMWIVSHLSFLRNYYALFNQPGTEDLVPVEKAIFSTELMKPYRKKYWLKIHMPALHNSLVWLKKKL